jgi:hypothetical protein
MCSKDNTMSGSGTCSAATLTGYARHATLTWSETDGTFEGFDVCRVVASLGASEVGTDATTDLPPAQRRVMGLYARDLMHSARVRKDRRWWNVVRSTCGSLRPWSYWRRCKDRGAKDTCIGLRFTHQHVQTDIWGRW